MIDNEYLTQGGTYVFRQLAEWVEGYRFSHSDVEVLDMGIGDVVYPVAPSVAAAMADAASEMAVADTFCGYPPTTGRPRAVNAVRRYYATMDVDDVCVSVGSGAKEELFAWCHILSKDVPALLSRPCYPAYVDANRLMGRRIVWAEGQFGRMATPRDIPYGRYVIYLCSPNNPTGYTYTLRELAEWVDFALDTHSLILFDAAYAAWVYPYSIFHVRGAERCAVEIGTLSKSASFSGLRFGWSAVGRQCMAGDAFRAYCRYKAVSSNGVSYVVERGAEAALQEDGMRHTRVLVERYRAAATVVAFHLRELGVPSEAGPYVWAHLPLGLTARTILDKVGLVVTPGTAFGSTEDYVRLSVLGVAGRIAAVQSRLRALFANA